MKRKIDPAQADLNSALEYQDCEAAFSILDGEIISGEFPRKQTRLVQAWIELHQESLMIDWKLAITGQELHRVEPLR